MFPTKIYEERRKALKSKFKKGVALFSGNTDVAFNYHANIYRFRQDSSFLYFFGIDAPNLYAVIDFSSGEEILFGNEITADDIIWMGNQPALADTAAKVGIKDVRPIYKLDELVKEFLTQGRKIHYLPPYRGETKIFLHELLGIPTGKLQEGVSEELVRAVVDLRIYKDEYEVKEIEKAVDVAYLMHTTSMRMASDGVKEEEIAGAIEGIALSHGGPVSFPVILSKNGQILHNHHHGNILKTGDLMVTDAGCEIASNYCSDITRTTPVGGKFTQKQKEVYEIVVKANLEVIKQSLPGVSYKDMHLLACKIIAEGLTELGIMKGNPEEAVSKGAHALFMPHGLGHMMGLDVHDLEGVSEQYAGYGDELERSTQFGLSALRMGRKLQPGFVFTDEPGIYFIPELIAQWRADKHLVDFINYKKLEEEYLDFGGIRIEDDILITEDGNRVLGKPIPKTVAEVEEIAGKGVKN